MFTSSDPNLADLDFELVDELQQNQPLNESMINELLSSSSPATYRIVKPM
jgi:DNA-binding Lrp family transcriptional regulator